MPVDWEVGGYALFEELDFKQNNLRPVQSEIQTLDQTYEQKTSSFAFYGEFLWELIDERRARGRCPIQLGAEEYRRGRHPWQGYTALQGQQGRGRSGRLR